MRAVRLAASGEPAPAEDGEGASARASAPVTAAPPAFGAAAR